jgi:transcription termination factor Rho
MSDLQQQAAKDAEETTLKEKIEQIKKEKEEKEKMENQKGILDTLKGMWGTLKTKVTRRKKSRKTGSRKMSYRCDAKAL